MTDNIYTEQNPNTQQHTIEKAFIGSLLRKPALMEDVVELLGEAGMSWKPYTDAWRAMKSLHTAGLGIDTTTLADELARMGALDDFVSHDRPGISGRVALTDIRGEGRPESVKDYAALLLDYDAKRAITRIMSLGAEWASNGRAAGDILADLNKYLGDIRARDGQAALHTVTLADAVNSAMENTIKASRGELVTVPTGLHDLDRITGGLSGGDLIVVAGRPGHGKTAFLCTLAYNISKGKTVAYFSLEMANNQIVMRLISIDAGIDYQKQKIGKMTAEEWDRYYAAAESLYQNHSIILNDLSTISPNKIRQELRRMPKVDVVMVDYIQLAQADGQFKNRVDEVGSISRGLKLIAKDFDVPVIAAAQLSRAVETRQDKKPQLSDLRESGSIEQDADIVSFLYRENEDNNETKLLISKHRNGSTGFVPMVFIPNRTKFESLAMMGDKK